VLAVVLVCVDEAVGDEEAGEVIFTTEPVGEVEPVDGVVVPIGVVEPVSIGVLLDVREPEVTEVPGEVLLPAEPMICPLPARYAGGALYKEGSTKAPLPYAIPPESVRGAATEDPSVPLIRKRVTQSWSVGALGSEN